MPAEIDLRKLRPQAWAKLNRKCWACANDHADIEFTFNCKDLPKGYLQSGQFTRSWHWNCLPIFLRQYQANDEADMWKTAQTPP